MRKAILCLCLCFEWSSYLLAAELDLTPLEQVPVQHMGRVKPFYSFALQSWQSVYGKSEWKRQKGGKLSAVATITDIWLSPGDWAERKIVYINYTPLREELGMDKNDKHASWKWIIGNEVFLKYIEDIQKKKAIDPKAQLNRLEKEVQNVGGRLEVAKGLIDGSLYRLVSNPESQEEAWVPIFNTSFLYGAETSVKVLEKFHQVSESYERKDQEAFNNAIQSLQAKLFELKGHGFVNKDLLELEQRYLVLHPFRWAAIMFALALVASVVTLLWQKKAGYFLSWGFVGVGFLLQIYGLICRSFIAGRPPVTNMYETVIWVAFGVIIMALVFEAIYRCRYFLLGATPVAIISLLLADTQPEILNSSINPLVPVLRSNFWLTVHVITITSSYAAFALALGVGHIILIGVMLGKKISGDLHLYLYRTLQVGVLLLASGTILGGVWANYSWGRFWDWDPKETWALIALLSYLIVLHGRVAGWVKGFGLAVGSILCFLSVLMAWYGVNFVLGVGLHSYGFGTGGFQYVLAFVIAEVAFICIAWLRHVRISNKPLKSVI
ncbi:MAG: cytochrome c biogenesis protein CcsA [Verrucomicrobiota bacterium]